MKLYLLKWLFLIITIVILIFIEISIICFGRGMYVSEKIAESEVLYYLFQTLFYFLLFSFFIYLSIFIFIKYIKVKIESVKLLYLFFL
jgi:hypothetical protein